MFMNQILIKELLNFLLMLNISMNSYINNELDFKFQLYQNQFKFLLVLLYL